MTGLTYAAVDLTSAPVPAIVTLTPTATQAGISVSAPSVAAMIVSPFSLGPPGPAGPTGPEGPSGPQGPAGSTGSSVFATAIFTGVAAGQVISLAATALSFRILITGGLVESPANYSVSGLNLTIPAGLVSDGQPCFFIYQTS